MHVRTIDADNAVFSPEETLLVSSTGQGSQQRVVCHDAESGERRSVSVVLGAVLGIVCNTAASCWCLVDPRTDYGEDGEPWNARWIQLALPETEVLRTVEVPQRPGRLYFRFASTDQRIACAAHHIEGVSAEPELQLFDLQKGTLLHRLQASQHHLSGDGLCFAFDGNGSYLLCTPATAPFTRIETATGKTRSCMQRTALRPSNTKLLQENLFAIRGKPRVVSKGPPPDAFALFDAGTERTIFESDQRPELHSLHHLTQIALAPRRDGYLLSSYEDPKSSRDGARHRLLLIDTEGNLRWNFDPPELEGRGTLHAGFLPDGTILYVASNTNGTLRLHRLDSHGTARATYSVPLPHNEQFAREFFLSPQQRYVLFGLSSPGTYRARQAWIDCSELLA